MNTIYDVVIVGGGASGLMTCVGIFENCKSLKVTIIEKNEKIGKKIYITGKGRCNFANATDNNSIVSNIVHNGKFMFSSLNKFSANDVMNFFETNNCPVIVKRGNRAFPKSMKSSDIIKVFSNYLKNNNVDLFLNETAKLITLENGFFNILTSNDNFLAKNLVIATGGKSYPLTGSTGDGYTFAKEFGHKITPLKPALCGFKVNNIDDLVDLTLKNIELCISVNDKIKFKEFGDITFYKNLIAGPLMLTASSLLNDYECFKITIDLKPKVEIDELKNRFYALLGKYSNQSIISFLQNFMPIKLGTYICKVNNILPNDIVKNINSETISNVFKSLKSIEFNSNNLDKIENGIITAGGININEINPNNMQSKLINNLFFVGEVLDLDAFTGGFNMQIAFSTGYSCGEYIAKKLGSEVNV